jgi:RNA polymerase sigma factor (sigma-70 family)
MCGVNAQPGDESAVMSGGSRQRFDALFHRHVAGVASYCRWRSRSLTDAEDAVADVFLIAWRRFDEVPAGDDARPWLYATARRVLANQARANTRRRRLNEKLRAEPQPNWTDEDPRIGRVHDALAALDPHDRELLLLVEWEGLTPTEVAAVLHRPPVAVRVRLHRARGRFRAAYEARTAAKTAQPPSSPLLSRCEP